MYQIDTPSTALRRGMPHPIKTAVLQPSRQYGGIYSLSSSGERNMILLPSIHGHEGLSQIYPMFTGKVSTLAHFPPELGCEDYSYLGQVATKFEHGLDSIDTSELYASFDEHIAIGSSASSGFLHWVSTFQIALNCRFLSNQIAWCQARALLLPVS